jgi:hypothetical protein
VTSTAQCGKDYVQTPTGLTLLVKPGNMGRGQGEDSVGARWFPKGCSTEDHILVMQSMIEQALAKTRGKLYEAFVDFRKAYDLVHKNVSWSVLQRAGTEGHVQLSCCFSL